MKNMFCLIGLLIGLVSVGVFADQWDPGDDTESGATYLGSFANSEKTHSGHTIGDVNREDYADVFKLNYSASSAQGIEVWTTGAGSSSGNFQMDLNIRRSGQTSWINVDRDIAPLSELRVKYSFSGPESNCEVFAIVYDPYGRETSSYDLHYKNMPVLHSDSISGPGIVEYNTSAQYYCTAYYSNGEIEDVTTSADWVAGWSIINGLLTVPSLGGATVPSTIGVGYRGGSATKNITIVPAGSGPTLSSITISGASYVNEGQTSQYTCTAIYSDGSSGDVTLGSLSVTSPYATISSTGVLTANQVSADQTVSIVAAYSGKSASKTVTIKDVTTPSIPIRKHKIAGGYAHSVAIRPDGSVVAWGGNYAGQCNVPSGLSDVVAVAAGGQHSLALKADGTVVAWGDNSSGQCNVPSGLSGVVTVAAGGSHSLALKSNGTVVAWGSNSSGQCNVPSGLSGVVSVAGGDQHSLALKSNGTVVAWGDNSYGQCTVPSGLTGIAAIEAGLYHSLARQLNTSEIFTWGSDSYGQCTVPSGLHNVGDVAGGEAHSIAMANGTVVAWGYDAFTGVPSGLSGVAEIASGDRHSLALKSDGSIVAWGDNSYGQCNVPVPVTLSSITVEGPSAVDENSSTNYACVAHYSDGSSEDVTLGSLSLTSPYATISSTGVLVANNVYADQTVTVMATYGGKSASKNVTIRNVVDVPDMDLSGSWYIKGGASYYSISLTYLGNAEYRFSSASANFVYEGIYEVSEGLLVMKIPDNPNYPDFEWDIQSINKLLLTNTGYAGATLIRVPDYISIDGVSQVVENTSSDYRCLAHYGYGDPEDITSGSLSVTSPFAAMSSIGTLYAKEVATNETVTINANFGDKSASKNVVVLDDSLKLDVLSGVVSYVFGNASATVTFEGTVTDPLGNPVANAWIGVEDPVVQMTLVKGATTDGQGRFTYVTQGQNPGVASVFRFFVEDQESIYVVPFVNESKFEYLDFPGKTITAGQVGLDASTLASLNFMYWYSDRIDQLTEFGEQVKEDAVAMGALVTEGAKEEPVIAGASVTAVVSCGITAALPNPISGTVCGASVVFLKVAVPVTVIKHAGLIAIENSSLSAAEKEKLSTSLEGGAILLSVVTGSGAIIESADIAWSGYKFLKHLDEGVDSEGRIYTEYEVENENGEHMVMRMTTAAAPVAPVDPQPMDGETGVSRSTVLEWGPVEGANGYEVWFGTDSSSMQMVATVSTPRYDCGLRKKNTQYYWQIVATNFVGRAAGEQWSFSTTDTVLPSEALNTVGIDWNPSSGAAPWFAQSAQTHDGTSAMQSGAIAGSRESVLESTVLGPGTLRFWWKVSSESGHDYLDFHVGADLVDGISGTPSVWVQETVTISNSGPQVLRWVYRKDAAGSAGQDCGWLDEVEWDAVNRTVYPISGYGGKWASAFLWDYDAEKWTNLGQEYAPTELVVDNLKDNQWYWLCIMELNGGEWEYSDSRFIYHEYAK